MNKEMIRALLAMTVFAAVLLGLACGVGDNGNRSQIPNQNQNSNSKPPDDDLAACRDSSSGKPGNIDKEIKNGMTNKLSDELLENNKNGSFSFKTIVRQPGGGKPDFLEMYVQGTILGRKEFHEFATLVRKAIKEDGSCVRNVYFITPTTPIPTQLSATTTAVDPGWSFCEPPDRPCSDGSCGCSKLPAPTPTITNTNSNTGNTSSNTNSARAEPR
jgi:hypothetical protein